jgi:DNA-binding PadR family transcriptional regulator
MTEHGRIEARGGGRGREWDRERGPDPGSRHDAPEGRHGHEGRGGGRGRWHAARGEGRERLERGLLRYVILDVLRDGARHGYEIIKQIEEQTQGRYMPSAGTLYPTLQYLEDLSFVTASQDEGRKVYRLTATGSAELAQHAEEAGGFWSRFAEPGGSDANQYEVGFLRDALDDLSRTVWSSLRAAIASDETATIRAVRRAVEQCQNEIRDIVAQAGKPRSEDHPPPQGEG